MFIILNQLENIILSIQENDIVNFLSERNVVKNLPKVVDQLLVFDYFRGLKILRQDNQRNKRAAFESFNDLEMIYYYVHQEKHIRGERNRKNNTKREYMRELIQFFFHLLHSNDFLKQDVPDYIDGSMFKNLRGWHIENYQEMLVNIKRGNKKDKHGERSSYSPATIHRKVTIIKSFLRWLYENQYIQENLHMEFKSSALKKIEIPNKDLYYSEVIQLLDYYKDHPINHCLLTMLALSGLRVQEVANAKWKDLYIHPKNGRYYLKVIGKNDTPIHALIQEVVYERIIKFRERRGLKTVLDPTDDRPLFTTRTGKAFNYKYLSNYIIDIIEKTELDFIKTRSDKITPHSFRHFWAIYSRQQGASVYDIQKRLGHSSVTVTERYLEKDQDLERDPGLLWNGDNF